MFTLPKIRILAPGILGILAGIAFTAPVVSAAAPGSSFGVAFAKKSSHGSFGFTFTTGGGYWQPAPPPAAVCAPAVWVPAHYETVLEKVWIEGQTQKVWCNPAYAWRRDACGNLHKVLVTPGHWKVVCTPGHYESRRVQVLEPGHWQSGPYAH